MQKPHMRPSVRRLMATVAVLTLGLAFLRYAVAHWGANDVTILALFVLLGTNVLTWFLSVWWKVFRIGFGLFGWAFLMLSFSSPLAEHLPTAWLLDGLHDRLYANQPIPAYDDFGVGRISAKLHADTFRRAGQSLFSLVFAFLGGCLVTLLFPRSEGVEVALPPDGSILGPEWRDRMSGHGESLTSSPAPR